MNGSEGFLRDIDICQLESGESHATVAIVEFPACRDTIRLDGLPPGHYPIYLTAAPSRWMYMCLVGCIPSRFSVIRHLYSSSANSTRALQSLEAVEAPEPTMHLQL